MRSARSDCPFPHALPVFSTDTAEEADLLIITFGSLVHSGALAGRHVYSEITREQDKMKAIDMLFDLRDQMAKVYAKMKKRKSQRKKADG